MRKMFSRSLMKTTMDSLTLQSFFQFSSLGTELLVSIMRRRKWVLLQQQLKLMYGKSHPRFMRRNVICISKGFQCF